VNKSDAARLNGKKGGRPKKAGTSRESAPQETHASIPTETQEPTETHAAAPLDNPHGLTPRELLFVEAYCGVANFQPLAAYTLAGYKPDAGNAQKLTVRYRVAQAIAGRIAVKAARLRVMDGDEALERLTLYARADIGKVLDPTDRIARLPDDIRLTIKTVRPGAHGRTIELYDSMKATELMAKSAGKLKDIVKVEHTLEEVMALANQSTGAAA
jgi:hypothetical protein